MNANYRAATLAAVAELTGTGVAFTVAELFAQFGRIGVPGTGVTADRWSNAVQNLLTEGRKALTPASVDAMLLAAVGTVISGDRQLLRDGATGAYTFADIS